MISLTGPQFVALMLAVIAILALAGWFPVWCYHRGKTGSNPTPKLPKLTLPVAAPAEPLPDLPRLKHCPRCHKESRWELSDDRTEWTCRHRGCGHAIPGPKAPVDA